MKKFILFAAAMVMFSGMVFAQANQERKTITPEQRIDFITARVQKRLMLDDATAAKFAPIYKEYLQAKAECRPSCVRGANLTDEQIKENISKRIEAEEKAAAVDKKYYKKLSSILSGRQLQQVFCNGYKNSFAQGKKFNKNNKNNKWNKGARKGRAGRANCPQRAANCPFVAPASPAK